jgi:predicted Rossmann fold flavoprotein
MNLIVIGGGAAGIFAALAAKKLHPEMSVLVLEKTAVLLSKVKISGGGRCNVTHACFDPGQLVKNYPRGEKELLGPFHRFQPRDTIEWFESRGVKLKTESDGRMFPITDSSSTIIECLLSEARKLGVELRLRQRVEKIEKGFTVHLKDLSPLSCTHLILASGSSLDGLACAQALGHTLQPPVPSLFTFNVPTSPLKELSGVSVESATVTIGPYTQTGPLLITHFGFSGPAVLKLSAWGARYLHDQNYRTEFFINWVPKLSQENLLQKLLQLKEQSPQKTLLALNPFYFPKNLWKQLLGPVEKSLAHLSKKELHELAQKLHADRYQMDGKTTHKEEFVTCGGVTLKEVDFKTMQSKICPGLYFAGEILDIDGITGGFNFQNAWTTGYIAGTSIQSNN